MAFLADLHRQGVLLAAGPLANDRLRGLNILRVDREQARALLEQDPAVRAGRFAIEILPWAVPAGAMQFSPTRFPRSMSEVADE